MQAIGPQEFSASTVIKGINQIVFLLKCAVPPCKLLQIYWLTQDLNRPLRPKSLDTLTFC